MDEVLLLYRKGEGPYTRRKITSLNIRDGAIYFRISDTEKYIKIDEMTRFEISKLTSENRWMVETCGTCNLCVPKMGGHYCNSGPDVNENYNWHTTLNNCACSGWREKIKEIIE